jgi:hypothetical protein
MELDLTPERVVPLRLGMIFSENRLPLFGIMPVGPAMAAGIGPPANGEQATLTRNNPINQSDRQAFRPD